MEVRIHIGPFFYPRERLDNHCTRGWVDPSFSLEGPKISSPPGFVPGTSSSWSVAIPTELPDPIYIYRISNILHTLLTTIDTIGHACNASNNTGYSSFVQQLVSPPFPLTVNAHKHTVYWLRGGSSSRHLFSPERSWEFPFHKSHRYEQQQSIIPCFYISYISEE